MLDNRLGLSYVNQILSVLTGVQGARMSENSNGMSDLATGDSEPSMEDILASIRKIIADDKSETPTFETEPEELLTTEIETDFDISSFSEKIEEQQFEIPEVEGVSQTFDDTTPEALEVIREEPEFEDEEILDLINFAKNEVVEEDETELAADFESATGETDFELATGESESSFDENLDLVMDSDASDYYTQSAESNENQLLREEIENDLDVEMETVELSVSSAIGSEFVNADDDLPAAPDLDELLDAGQDEQREVLTLDDEEVDELLSALDTAEGSIEQGDALEATGTDLSDDVFVPELFSEEVSNSAEDQDMDLVKSLLEELMDEPESSELDDELSDTDNEDVFDSFIEESAETENILDEILYQSLNDENVVAELSSEDAPQEESELAQIARTAREAAAAPFHGSDEIKAEDKVELPERHLDKRLHLSAAGGFVGVAAGGTVASDNSDNTSDDLNTQVSQMVGEELERADIEELLELVDETETVETEQDQTDADQAALEALDNEIELPQEEEKMGRTAKNEALLNEDIEQKSSDAFAALSHVVQEKAEMEENGPAIGDLVQDALRPMLREWLEKNLKGIVERAVTKEVKRISSGK